MLMMAIKDRATDAFQVPFFTHTVGQAMRMFIDAVNTKDSQMGAHPEDYDLYELGYFNEDTGEIGTTGLELRARAQDHKQPS